MCGVCECTHVCVSVWSLCGMHLCVCVRARAGRGKLSGPQTPDLGTPPPQPQLWPWPGRPPAASASVPPVVF